MQLYRQMDRIWGTRPLIQMVQASAAHMSRKYPGKDRLQVEDMSARNGGDIQGHGSHENGLDVDLGYFKANGIEHNPYATGKQYADSMVLGNRVSSNFDVERNWELAKALHQYGDVQRIFMDQKLKNELCRYAKTTNQYLQHEEILRSIRHADHHEDHLHVRLRCPAGASRCVTPADPPAGSGCP